MTGVGSRELGVWGLAVAGGVAVVAAAVAPVVSEPGALSAVSRQLSAEPARPYAADSLAKVVVARDVFRVGRRAAQVSYDPAQAAQPPVPPAPKPVLTLVGIVTGAEPAAVIEGFPGVEGARVVRVGDVVAGLRVLRISDNDVRITGMDTTWVLKVREPWR